VEDTWSYKHEWRIPGAESMNGGNLAMVILGGGYLCLYIYLDKVYVDEFADTWEV
jgi:hypothetical protein